MKLAEKLLQRKDDESNKWKATIEQQSVIIVTM